MNCLGVFNHFGGLGLKGLIDFFQDVKKGLFILQRRFSEKVFCKYAANLQKNTYTECDFNKVAV